MCSGLMEPCKGPMSQRFNSEKTRGTPGSASCAGRPEALPGVLLVFSLVKRWVMGTLHGSISPEHMPAYFDEWVFRFNPRHSRSRGLLFRRLLQQAVEGDALTYSDLRKAGRTRPPPPPPARVRWLPPSLEREESGLPCRDHEA